MSNKIIQWREDEVCACWHHAMGIDALLVIAAGHLSRSVVDVAGYRRRITVGDISSFRHAMAWRRIVFCNKLLSRF